MGAIKYTFYRGLQKPLEFMGIRGRFIILAAVSIFGCILIFFAINLIIGTGTAAFMALTFAFGGMIVIYIKQKQGLHSKKRAKGIFIYRSLWQRSKIE